jgi:type II secretory pathway pseudopilin PulG
VVIAVIGILSGLIVVSMNGTTQKATIAKGQIFSNSLRNSLMSNLVAEWKIDEGTGTSINDFWNNISGTLTNFNFDTTDGWKTDCIYGNCLLFDGSNDFVVVNESENLKTDDITLEVWINPALVTNGSPIRTTTSNKFYLAFHPDGNFTWHVRKSDNTGSYIYSNTVVPVNKWHHIVATFKAQSFQRLYLDGVIVAETTGFTWSPLVVTGNYGWRIGGSDWSASAACFKGYIDNVRFYNSGIPISKIEEQYYLGLNKLLSKGDITEEEYLFKINDVSYSK